MELEIILSTIGILLALIGVIIALNLYNNQKPNLKNFKKKLHDKDNWTRHGNRIPEQYQYEKNKDYNIVIEEENINKEIDPPWNEWCEKLTGMDKKAFKYHVKLMIGTTEIKELIFISTDGGRIFVPFPNQDDLDEQLYFNWNRNSLEFLVCTVVGSYSHFNTIEKLADKVGVRMIGK